MATRSKPSPIQQPLPIAMTVALEVVAELRAQEKKAAVRIMRELFAVPPPPRR
jgi:hypothetical protein